MPRQKQRTAYTTYVVPPFSRQERARSFRMNPEIHGECAICMRPVTMKNALHTALVVDHGNGPQWGTEPMEADAPEFVGYYPVGNTCHDRFVKEEK